MTQILITLACAVILSVLAETLVSGGGMKKYARLAIGISVSTVLAIPIVHFFGGDVGEFDTQTLNVNYMSVSDEQFVKVLETSAETALLQAGVDVEISCTICGGEILEVVATSKGKLLKEKAEQIGFAVSEVLSIPLWKIAVKGW